MAQRRCDRAGDSTLDDVRAEVCQLRDELAALGTRVAILETHQHEAPAQRRREALSAADRATLTRQLPVIGAVFGSGLFTTRDLRRHADAGLRLVLAGERPERIGQRFGRAIGQVIGGYKLLQDGREGHRALWRVVREVR